MGACCGGANVNQQTLLRDQIDDHSPPAAKVLVLGIGRSGKNTLFKQMRRITHHVTDSDLEDTRAVVHQNVLQIMRTIAEQSIALNEHYEIKLDEDNIAVRDRFAAIDTYRQSTLSSEILDDWDQLWRDPGIQKTMQYRDEFRLLENADWFLQRLDDVSSYNYVPDMEDYVRARLRLTGVDKMRLELAESSATDSDVHTLTDAVDVYVTGGQRHERKRWPSLIRGTAAIIYVVGVGDYTQVIEEDNKKHIQEDFQVFKELMRYQPLQDMPIVIIFSKYDLVENRIKRHPLSNYVSSSSKGFDGAEGVIRFYRKAFEKYITDDRPVLWFEQMNLLDVGHVERFISKFRPWIRDILLQHSPFPHLTSVPSSESTRTFSP